MKNSTITIKANDGLALNTYKWMPEPSTQLKAILLLVHGSVEHAKRYEAFGEFLTQNGVGVHAFDLRGHGKTTDVNSYDFAHIPYKTGWGQLMDDVASVHKEIKETFPNTPLFLFGHSMGSFLVRDYISNRSAEFNGLILSGTTLGNRASIKMLIKVIKLITFFNHPKHKSKFLHKQIYDKLNNAIENPESSVDFISTDKNEVKKYLDDPLSGKTLSIGYAHEMAKGLIRSGDDVTLNKIPKELPILMISGKDDPVGGENAKEVTALYDKYKEIGLKDVTFKLYEGARHEILNEFNRDEVMMDILNWIDSNI